MYSSSAFQGDTQTTCPVHASRLYDTLMAKRSPVARFLQRYTRPKAPRLIGFRISKSSMVILLILFLLVLTAGVAEPASQAVVMLPTHHHVPVLCDSCSISLMKVSVAQLFNHINTDGQSGLVAVTDCKTYTWLQLAQNFCDMLRLEAGLGSAPEAAGEDACSSSTLPFMRRLILLANVAVSASMKPTEPASAGSNACRCVTMLCSTRTQVDYSLLLATAWRRVCLSEHIIMALSMQ